MKLAAAVTIAAALLAAAPQGWAQETRDVEVGAGRVVEGFASPGLEARTPAAGPINPDDVQILIPHEDQVQGFISIPDEKLSVLVQPEGRQWRAFRMSGLFWTAGAFILGTIALLAIFFLWRGRIRIESGRSGRWVPRFSGFERFTHWVTALSFLSLAISGLIITFGRPLLIPLIGHGAFSPLAEASKRVHNASALPFVLGIVVMLVVWLRDNIPNRTDLIWLRQAGGMFSKPGTPHPEAERFNAGQKGIFWIVILGGLAISVSGAFLMMPFAVTGISGMQIAHVIHSLLAAVLIAVIIAHIYLGTLGMEGAFDAMSRGEVDENWAKEHHRGWYDAKIRKKTRGASMPAE